MKYKSKECEKIEEEIVSIKKQLDKPKAQANQNLKFSKGNETLDTIVSRQRSSFFKTSMGYEGEISTKKYESNEPKINVEMLKESRNNVMKGINKAWG